MHFVANWSLIDERAKDHWDGSPNEEDMETFENIHELAFDGDPARTDVLIIEENILRQQAWKTNIEEGVEISWIWGPYKLTLAPKDEQTTCFENFDEEPRENDDPMALND